MRVQSGYNPYAYQQRQSSVKKTGFAEMFAKQVRASGDSFSRSPQALAQRVESGNDGGLYSDPAICEAVRMNKPVAANYPATLTQEQIDDLKSRYDIPNMKRSTKESVAFGEELFALGVIDDDQRKFFYGAVSYTKDTFPLGVLTPAGETPTRQLGYDIKPKDSMIDILIGELAVQQKNLDIMNSSDTSEKVKYLADDGMNMADHIKYLEDYTKQYQNIYDVMKQFI